MIADAVKSCGRSRHGQLAGAVMTVAKASGRQHTSTRSRHRTSTCSGRRKRVKAGWLESDRRGSSHERGNTPRWALFPFLFPPRGASSQVALAKQVVRTWPCTRRSPSDMSKPDDEWCSMSLVVGTMSFSSIALAQPLSTARRAVRERVARNAFLLSVLRRNAHGRRNKSRLNRVD